MPDPHEAAAMADAPVPGAGDDGLELPAGELVDPHEIDLGMREHNCPCGDTHAVVTDVHPPSRFVPESLVAVLEETIDTDDEFESFGTPHLLGIVLEEFPESGRPRRERRRCRRLHAVVGDRLRRPAAHEVVVELIVELMEHAVSHAEDDAAITEFESQMLEFDVGEFVDQYRRQREFESEHDQALWLLRERTANRSLPAASSPTAINQPRASTTPVSIASPNSVPAAAILYPDSRIDPRSAGPDHRPRSRTRAASSITFAVS